MSPYTELARLTLETYLSEREIMKPPVDLPKEMLKEKAGVFVSLHTKKGHSLRGCIGTFSPSEKNIASEIISNSIAAATRDPRFEPVDFAELEDLEIHVDVLSKPEPVKELADLNPRQYGVLVRSKDGRTGLLLPDLEGINTVKQQLEIACQKADLYEDDDFSIYRFQVERHEE